jgi:hypothetical protein
LFFVLHALALHCILYTDHEGKISDWDYCTVADQQATSGCRLTMNQIKLIWFDLIYGESACARFVFCFCSLLQVCNDTNKDTLLGQDLKKMCFIYWCSAILPVCDTCSRVCSLNILYSMILYSRNLWFFFQVKRSECDILQRKFHV